MKYAHSIKSRVILSEADEETGRHLLISLFSDNPEEFMEEQEPDIDVSRAKGLNGEELLFFEWTCERVKHINSFIKRFVSRVNDTSLETLASQTDRFDDDLNFYVRLDRSSFEEGEWKITRSGNCVHIRIHIAAYPAKRETAERKIEELFVNKTL